MGKVGKRSHPLFNYRPRLFTVRVLMARLTGENAELAKSYQEIYTIWKGILYRLNGINSVFRVPGNGLEAIVRVETIRSSALDDGIIG